MFIVLPAPGKWIWSGLSSSQKWEERDLVRFFINLAWEERDLVRFLINLAWEKRDLVRFLINLAWEERNLVWFIVFPALGREESGLVYRPPSPWSGSCCTRMDPPKSPPIATEGFWGIRRLGEIVKIALRALTGYLSYAIDRF